jgi:hypothetical protein
MAGVGWTPDSTALPAVVALASLALLYVGLRGRRVNDHPICRRCGFDLVGRPPGSTRCPECGAELGGRRAVRVGARQRRGGLVTIALVLLVPSLACVGFLGWAEISGFPLVRHKPVWWLLNDARSTDPVSRDAAFTEMLRRLRSGELTRAGVRQVVGRALVVQADPRTTWQPQWGDVVEEAYRAGKVPAESWRQYVRQAPQSELVATESFKRGDRAWLELVEQPTRVGNKGELVLRIHRKLTITDAAGGSVERDFGWVRSVVGGRSRLQGGWALPLNEGVIGRLADGPHRARLEVVVEAYDGGAGDQGRAPVATSRFTLTTKWTVEPSTAPEAGTAVSRR